MKTNFCVAPLFLLLASTDAAVLLEKRGFAAPSGQAASVWNAKNANSGLKCLGWRKTLTCTPSGPRDPVNDKDCLTVIASEESGFCECEGWVHTAAVPCGHNPVNCTKECGRLQNLHREKFSTGSAFGSAEEEDEEDERSGGAVNSIANSRDPYANAFKYGQRAVTNVERAVSNSNTLLKDARGMISKMMNLKPWEEIARLGKEAEMAGKKSQELSKLARPFIYLVSSGVQKNLRASPQALNMLLKSEGADTEEFTKGCLQISQAIVAESDGKKKSVASQLSLVCSGLQLPLDVDICQRYRSTLLSHLHEDAKWNMANMDYPLFCTGMGKVAAEQKAEVIAQIAAKQAEKDADAAKEAAVAADLAAIRAHWPTKKPAAASGP